jgi:tetratricopeptide (TPR) repeat protein
MTTHAATAPTTSTPGPRGRRPGQLWQVPVFLAGLVALLLVGVAAPLVPASADDKLDRDLAAVREALRLPRAPSDETCALADTCLAHTASNPDRAAEAHFLLGLLHMRLAEYGPAARARDERDKAGMHLKRAEMLDAVPAADRARLTYLLGKLTYLSGGDVLVAIDLLSRSLPGGADNPAEGYGMLVQCYLRKLAPDVDAALDANLRQLEICEDEGTRTQAWLTRGELFLKKDQRGEAIKALDQAAAKASPKVRLQCRLTQAKAAMDEGLWGRAIPWWQELLAQPEVVPGGRARILYNLGLCCLNHQPPSREKDATAAWQEVLILGGEEAQAAALRLGEMKLFAGQNQAAALPLFSRALEKVCTPAEYKNSLVDLRKARALLEEACRVFNENQDSERFLQAAELYKKLAPPGAAEEKVAQAAEARGRELLDKAAAGVPDADLLREHARTALHQAALAYEQAAETRSPAGRVDLAWRCVECYRLAEEPVPAIGALKKFVALPAAAERQAEAWYTLAEIQRVAGHPEARVSYRQCVAFNNDAFTSKALLHLADLALAEKDWHEAEDVLLQIAVGPVADRAAHEQALLQLANLYFALAQFDKASIQCVEMIKQYPAHPAVLGVRELLGECHRKLADAARKSGDNPEVVSAEKKAFYRGQWQQHLESARDVYQQLADDLEAQTGFRKLSIAEDTLRRKAAFVAADCYLELPNWFDEAHLRFTKLFDRYRDEPDGLWACQRLVLCLGQAAIARHPKLGAIRETASAAVEHCLFNLEKYDRAGAFRNAKERRTWERWLEEVHEWFQQTKERE